MFGVSVIFFNTIVEAISLKPILNNFRIEEANKDRVYFSTPIGPVTGMTTQGFIIHGKTITAVDTVNNYFTVSVAFDFWDNDLIRLESGDGVVHDFTLEHIINNNDEPSAVTPKWSNSTGSGTESGDSEANAWSHTYAFANATAGMTVNMLAGGSTTAWVVGNSGAVDNPIKFIGYNNAAKDVELVRTTGMAFDDTVMPNLNSNKLTCDGKSNIIIKNIQIDRNDAADHCTDFNGSTNIYLENSYMKDGKNGAFSFRNDVLTRFRLRRYYGADMASTTMGFPVDHGLSEDLYNCTSRASSNDYYLSLQGTPDGAHSIIKDVVIDRFITDSHGSHGIAFKADEHYVAGGQAWKIEHSLVQDASITGVGNQMIDVQHEESQYNVFRRINTFWDGSHGFNYLGIQIKSAQHTIFESCDIQANYGVSFLGSSEDELAVDAGNNTVFKNCIFRGGGVDLVPLMAILQNTDGQLLDRVANDNTWINCTFIGHANLLYNNFSGGQAGTGNKLVNCLIIDVPLLQGTGTTLPFSYDYSDFWNSFTTPAGTGNFSADPVLDVTFKPTATFTNIDVPLDPIVLYDLNNSERTDPTAVGAVKHDDEVVAPDTTAPLMTLIVIEDAAPTDVVMTFDEPVSGTNLGFTIAGTTSTTFASISGSGTVWTGVLAIAAEEGETITLSYAEATGDFKDSSDNALEDITTQAVTNNVVAADQYYDFDRSANAYMDTNLVLTGLQNTSFLYKGTLLSAVGESRVFGFDDSHTLLFFVYDEGDANEITVQWYDGTNSSNIYEDYVSDELEHIFIMTFDSVTGVKFYIDGIEVYSGGANSFTGWGTTGNLQLGTKNNAPADVNGLFGTMDRFQVYNRSISQAEVTTLQSNIAGVSSGKIADWGDQKTSSVWTDDVSGYTATNAGDVTLVGAAPPADPDVYPQDNAASVADVNSTASYSSVTGTPTVTSDADAYDGSYAIKVVSGAETSITKVSFPTQAGKKYNVSIWAKRGVGVTQRFRTWQNVGSFTQVTVDTTSYVEYTWTGLIPDVAGTDADIRVYASYTGGFAGDSVFVDKIVVTELDI